MISPITLLLFLVGVALALAFLAYGINRIARAAYRIQAGHAAQWRAMRAKPQ